jgi:hypothetical protein
MKLHPEFSYRVDYVGNEQQPVLVVDNFLSEASLLVDFCANNSRFVSAGAFYPGARSPAPDVYVQALHRYLKDIIYATFSIDDSMVKSVQSDYSMVLTDPAHLKLEQCIPHYDSLITRELASVHYLCKSDQGGTSLYRHRHTGFEYIDNQRVANYRECLKKEIASTPYPQRYMNGSNHLFEQIASYDSRFNRIVLYRCTSLHSGNIAPGFLFDPNPRTGRLTINTFIGL